MKTATIYTHGCRLNQADSALISDRLQKAGFKIVDWGTSADLMIVNSCVVTEQAARKSRQTLRSAKKKNPNTFIIMTGCGPSAQSATWLANDDVDLIVENLEKQNILSLLPPTFHLDNQDINCSTQSNEKKFYETGVGHYPKTTRANIKIQEGCNFFCSYCIIPKGRGNPRSRDWDDIIREFTSLIERGHKEVVLTGINIATYNDKNRDLADLIYQLSLIKGDFRLRLSSTEPMPLVKKLINTMKGNPKICRFIHIPIQYGENTILKKMNRKYTVEEFAQYANFANESIPELCIGTDIIVGFPGETQEYFEKCMQTVRNLPFSYLHIFTFSPRENTPAYLFENQVDQTTAKRRYKLLYEETIKKSKEFINLNKDKKLKVLIEKNFPESSGWSDNYIKINIINSNSKKTNYFCDVILEEYIDYRKASAKILI